jgi:hypothetical protein
MNPNADRLIATVMYQHRQTECEPRAHNAIDEGTRKEIEPLPSDPHF